jgi:hypothetical protein
MLVFLCHSSNDKVAVRELYQKLSKDGFDVWLDEEKLLPGQDWNREIIRAVRKADTVIVCLSKSSVSKTGYIQKEIRMTLDAADERPDGAIFLIPAKLEECSIPDRLARFQWVDLYIADGYDKLIKALHFAESTHEQAKNIAFDNSTKIETGLPRPQSPSNQTSEFRPHKINRLTLVIRSTGVSQRDRERINKILDTLRSYHGEDWFSLQIIEKDGSGHLIDFAKSTTHICVDLLVELHNILYQTAPFLIEELFPQSSNVSSS